MMTYRERLFQWFNQCVRSSATKHGRYASVKLCLQTQEGRTQWLNISLGDLSKIEKILVKSEKRQLSKG